jgi:hypothetical protein
MTSSFLIPFEGRNSSGAEKINFLWKNKNIYIMDNHRLASWCWSQELGPVNPQDPIHLFHLDAHYDCDPVAVEHWNKFQLKHVNFSLHEFIHLKNVSGKTLILWDNYLPVFLNEYRAQIKKTIFATHDIGLKEKADDELKPYDLLKPLDDYLLFHKPWIVNIDLDYFYPRHDKAHPFLHPELIKKFFKLLKLNYDEGHIKVLTICLSPECCGGWEQAESLLNIFLETFDLSFSLSE